MTTVTRKINISEASRIFGSYVNLKMVLANFSIITMCQIPGWQQIQGTRWERRVEDALLEVPLSRAAAFRAPDGYWWLPWHQQEQHRIFGKKFQRQSEEISSQNTWKHLTPVHASKCQLPAILWRDKYVPGLIRFLPLPVPSVFLPNFVIEKKMLSQFFLAQFFLVRFAPYGLLSAASNYF